MGHGLHRMNRSHRGKLPIVIPEGNIRPLVPLVAAKFASECNIAVRNHVPVLTHWKEYKGRSAVIDTFLGILRVSKFSKAFPHLPVLNHACILPCYLVHENMHYYKHKQMMYSNFIAIYRFDLLLTWFDPIRSGHKCLESYSFYQILDFLYMFFYLNRQSSTLTQMMMWLNTVALK